MTTSSIPLDSAPRRPRWDGRPVRYGATSILAFVLAQAGLALAYGILRWPVPAAVVFSFAVSAGPAYVLSRRLVWPDGCQPRARGGEAGAFLTVAAAGAAASLTIVWGATGLARTATTDHLTLSVIANGASILATGAIWVGRYYALDRLVFASGPSVPPVMGDGV